MRIYVKIGAILSKSYPHRVYQVDIMGEKRAFRFTFATPYLMVIISKVAHQRLPHRAGVYGWWQKTCFSLLKQTV